MTALPINFPVVPPLCHGFGGPRPPHDQAQDVPGRDPAEYGFTVRVVEITPDLAREWLKLNDNFRQYRDPDARQLARVIRAGAFHLDGQSIKFDGPPPDGRLKDGQHRLQAVVYADTPITSFVQWGKASDADYDTGRPRKISDYLRKRGLAHHNALAAAGRLKWAYDNGLLNVCGVPARAVRYDIDEVIEANPGLIPAAAATSSRRARGRLSPGLAAFCRYEFDARDAGAAERFFRQFSAGVDLGAGDPVLLLRERFEADHRSQSKLRSGDRAALVFLAWNARLRGGFLKQLEWSPKKDAFPAIDGNPTYPTA
jgi:hypothetical protein